MPGQSGSEDGPATALPITSGETCHYERGNRHGSCDIIEVIEEENGCETGERHWCTTCGHIHIVEF